MKAMILAAGLGTRLGELSRTHPKALAEVNGKTLLQITLARLRWVGVEEVVINVHHFADQIEDYLTRKANFGMKIHLSHEAELLDTGGGLRRAARLLLGETDAPTAGDDKNNGGEPILLHNVDVVSAINLRALIVAHQNSGALATLAVQRRESSRLLLFDHNYELCGRVQRGQAEELAREALAIDSFAFCGIHALSPRLLRLLAAEPRQENEAFPLIPEYLRLAAQGERISAFQANGVYWRDLGTPESLAAAAEELKKRQLLV